jgi:hypothetical protein
MQTAQCTCCSARYHCGCLQAWLVKGKRTCPLCRQETLQTLQKASVCAAPEPEKTRSRLSL